MSKEHLRDLRKKLKTNHWHIVSEKPGNDYDISAVWEISRPDGSDRFEICFTGLNDLHALPVEKSYACHIRDRADIGAYFSRMGRGWNNELEQFVSRLNKLH